MTPDITPETFPHLFIGYSVFWLLIVVFLFQTMREQRRLARELRELSRPDKREARAQG